MPHHKIFGCFMIEIFLFTFDVWIQSHYHENIKFARSLSENFKFSENFCIKIPSVSPHNLVLNFLASSSIEFFPLLLSLPHSLYFFSRYAWEWIFFMYHKMRLSEHIYGLKIHPFFMRKTFFSSFHSILFFLYVSMSNHCCYLRRKIVKKKKKEREREAIW